MAKQTFTVGQVLTAAQLTSLQQTAMLGGAASAKTASYTLVAADAGGAISMTSTSATTITVNTGLFAAGDTVQITNLGAGVCTITAGTATVNTSASLALAQYESGTLDFTSTSAAIFIKGAGAPASGATFSGVSLYKSTDQSISSGSGTNVSFDSEFFDTDGYHDNTTNNSRITIPSGKAGYYLLTAKLVWNASGSGQRILTIRKNAGATNLSKFSINNQTAGVDASLGIQYIADLSVGDYVYLEAYQDGSGPLGLQGFYEFATQFSAIYLGA